MVDEMRDPAPEIYDFLTSINMNPAQTDSSTFLAAFLAEMDAGLAGRPSSLRMIPTYVSAEGAPPDGEKVITIDAGGTNLRVALVEFQNGRPVVLREQSGAMPGSRGEVGADAFFDELAEAVVPFAGESGRIGFCFSYPTEMHPDGDGEIICLTKEVRVRGIEGCVIGAGLLEKLREKGAERDFSLVLLNDTTAGLLGGRAELGLDPAGGLAGLVLGTGCNSCYAERGGRIAKLPGAPNMIVNCESGNFAGAFRGRADELLDAGSENPGAYLFEKMTSGAYLGGIVTQEAALAAREGLLSPAFTALERPMTTTELDELLRGGENRVTALCRGTDREALRCFAESAFDRSAKLVSAKLLALCLHCGGGESAETPFTVVAEGSTFYRSLLLRPRLEAYLQNTASARGRHIVLCRAAHATLAGAAFAALTR